MTGHSKLSPQAKLTVAEHNQSDESHTLGVIVEGNGQFAQDQLAELERGGVQIRTVAGDILTADVPAGSVEALAQHNFVRRVEVSQPLFSEAEEEEVPFYGDVE